MIKKVLIPVLIVLLIDQIVKIWIKTHYSIGEEHGFLGDWFKIHFTENPGMAFGWILPFDNPKTSKLFLSIFRVLAVSGIGYYLWLLVKRKDTHPGLIFSIALIFAGAFGNILDSAFYGLFFGPSDINEVATVMPEEGGYAGFLLGNVVDMLRFDVDLTFPTWFPGFGGNTYSVFPPIFNIADMTISAGVAIIIINQRKYFGTPTKEGDDTEQTTEGQNSVPEEVVETTNEESSVEYNTETKAEQELPEDSPPTSVEGNTTDPTTENEELAEDKEQK